MAAMKKAKPTVKPNGPKSKKRQSTRFPSDAGTLAFMTGDSQGKKLPMALPALVVEESFKGCSLLALSTEIIEAQSDDGGNPLGEEV